MNTVVLYTSHYGATERYARALAAALGASCFALGEPTASQTFVLSEAKALAGSRVSATTSAEEITLFMETDHTSSIHKLPIL